MNELISNARTELLKCGKMRVKYEKTLAELPKGRLKADDRKGRKYYFCTVNGKESYIGRKKPELVRALKDRRFAEEALKIIEGNEKCLTNLIDNLESMAPQDILKKLPKSYLPEEVEGRICGAEISGDEWEKRQYRKKVNLERYRDPSQVTLKGELVRSKSELNIANMLYMKGIPYHYEEEHEFGEHTIAPDFTVYVRSEGTFKLLEHCGVMNNPKYRGDLAWKMYVYIKYGYMPFRDVFFTFDDIEGNMDTRFIEYIIDTYLT